MSDKPIAIGDLVMVVRSRACGCSDIPHPVFKVGFLEDITEYELQCKKCGAGFNGIVAIDPNRRFAKELYRLKRIDPPALSDETPTREELTA